MADQLATPEDLASLLERDDVDAYKATLVIECATAVVQDAAGGQRIVEVVDDTIELTGTTSRWLQLPQQPVSAVTAVTLDGTTLTAGAAGGSTAAYRLRGSRLWRGDGWQTYAGEPSTVGIVYTHGRPAGHQKLQLARRAVLGLCAPYFGNTAGAASERIDDYAVTYDAMATQLQATPALAAALRRTYGRRGVVSPTLA